MAGPRIQRALDKLTDAILEEKKDDWDEDEVNDFIDSVEDDIDETEDSEDEEENPSEEEDELRRPIRDGDVIKLVEPESDEIDEDNEESDEEESEDEEEDEEDEEPDDTETEKQLFPKRIPLYRPY
jgi:ribonuclease E